MIDQQTAYKIVKDEIESSYKLEGDEVVIIDDRIIEEDFGWIFFYQSRRALETNIAFLRKMRYASGIGHRPPWA